MSYSLILSFFSLLFLLSTFSARGQEPRTIDVRSLCFKASAGVKSLTVAGDPKGESIVDFKLKRYLQTKQEKLTLTNNQIFIGPDGGGEFGSWGSISIEPNLTEVLLLFLPTGQTTKPYKVIPFDDSVKSFPLGSFQIINLSPNALRLIVGKKPFQLKRGERTTISKFQNKKANGQVAYYAFYQNEGDWKRLSSGFWDVVPRKRNLQIAYQNPKSGRLEMRGFEDGLPVVKALLQQQEDQ